MKTKNVKKILFGLFFLMVFTCLNVQAQSYIDCRFTPTTNCDQYCVLLEISSKNGEPLYIGSSSIRFSYDASVLNFAGTSMDGLTVGTYTSINFDDDQDSLHPDCLVENGGQGGTPYSAHSFDGGTPGDFLNTWVLQVPTVFGNPYACPIVDDWTQVAEVCFEVLDPTGDPDFQFDGSENEPVEDLTGTNFNDDASPPNKYWNGTLGELHTSFASFCGENIEGCTDENSCNYNQYATVDDGSCSNVDPNTGNTDICAGDTEVWNANTCSYDIDIVQVLGCTDATASNYNPDANCDDASCEESMINARFIANIDNCDNNEYCVFLQISTQDNELELGHFSMAFSYNQEVISYSTYESLNFDNNQSSLHPDCLIENGGSGEISYNAHTFDYNEELSSNEGLFLLTALSLPFGSTCPQIGEEWITVSEVCFEILDASNDPAFIFNSDITLFNTQSNTGSTYNNGNFEELHTSFATLCGGIIEGCTDATTSNYNPEATVDDGSCSYSSSGCTDPTACNYDADSTVDDGSCSNADPSTGNTDICMGDIEVWNATTCNYDIVTEQILGCTDATYYNYNAAANCDDGSCANNCVGDIYLTTQAEVDAFPSTYDCGIVLGDLSILFGEDITHLDSLYVVTGVEGKLDIEGNPYLTHLFGLENLTTVGGKVQIENNGNLYDFQGLINLQTVGDNFYVGYNPLLYSMNGTPNLTHIDGDLTIRNNTSLGEFGINWGKDLETITGSLKVLNNGALENFTGFSDLKTIGGELWVRNNPQLKRIWAGDGISLDSLGGLKVEYNPRLIAMPFLEGIEEIPNNVYLGFSNLFETNLINLSTIGGNLTIRDVPMTYVDLENLQQIGGGLLIRSTGSLSDISALGNLEGSSLEYLHLYDNDALSNCCILSCIEVESENILIGDNGYLSNCASIEDLEACGTCVQNITCSESITFNTQADIDNFLYDGCGTIEGDVIVSGNDITNLTGLQNIITITGDLKIWNNPNLETLQGQQSLQALQSLQTIGGTLWVRQNESLTNIDGMPVLETIGGLKIEYNPQLVSFYQLSAIQEIPNDVYIAFNASLDNILGLSNVDNIGGNLTLRDIAIYNLGELDQLDSIGGGLLIRGTNNLDNISALYGLQGTLDYLHIYDNDDLADCCIFACWEEMVPSGDILVGDNLDGCNSTEDIDENCTCD